MPVSSSAQPPSPRTRIAMIGRRRRSSPPPSSDSQRGVNSCASVRAMISHRPSGGRLRIQSEPERIHDLRRPGRSPTTSTTPAPPGSARRWARRGVDVLFVTSPANLLYLTGYAAIWYPWRLPLGPRSSRAGDRRLLRLDAPRGLRAPARALRRARADGVRRARRRSWLGARGPGPRWDRRPGALGPDAGGADPRRRRRRPARARVPTSSTGDWIVDTVRKAKSPAEVERIRRAAAMADTALGALRDELRPACRSSRSRARLITLLVDAGSELAACNPLVSSGPTAWCDNHAAAVAPPGDGRRRRVRRRVRRRRRLPREPLAHVRRRHGEPARAGDARARRRTACGELQREARLGDGPEHRRGRGRALRARPHPGRADLVGRRVLARPRAPAELGRPHLPRQRRPRADDLAGGYVFNYETILLDRDDGFEAATIDTLLMTEHGLEVLSAAPARAAGRLTSRRRTRHAPGRGRTPALVERARSRARDPLPRALRRGGHARAPRPHRRDQPASSTRS